MTEARNLADAKTIKAARSMIAACEALIDALSNPIKYNPDFAMFDACNAAIALVDDGDFWRAREDIMNEYLIDEEGYPASANGDRLHHETAARVFAPDGSWNWNGEPE
jgi:hypothetical protein